MAVRNQDIAELFIVINLAVKHQHEIFILIINWLAARIQVNNGKAAETHRYAVIYINSGRIRPAVNNSVHHLLDNRIAVNNFPCKSD